jgi:hypothetical protein
VSASWEDGRIVVLVPSRLRSTERDAVVDELVQRLLRRAPMHHSDDKALEERSEHLADRYLGGVRATSIRWVGNQRKRWGSCNPGTGDIRISDRLRPVPSWVLDAVLVHELAHLVEASHSKRFRALTNRYPRMTEADTFLHGFTIGLEAANRAPSWNEEGSTADGLGNDGLGNDGLGNDGLVDDGICGEEPCEDDIRDDSRGAASPFDFAGDVPRAEPGRLFDPSVWDLHPFKR